MSEGLFSCQTEGHQNITLLSRPVLPAYPDTQTSSRLCCGSVTTSAGRSEAEPIQLCNFNTDQNQHRSGQFTQEDGTLFWF